MTDLERSTDLESAARKHVLAEHSELVASVLQCADRVVETWEGQERGKEGQAEKEKVQAEMENERVAKEQTTTDREAVVEPLSRELRETGLLARFPTVLSGAVAATGFSMQATPVPAPPYVAITSRGPVLRATVSEGRLVVSVHAFDVVRAKETQYVRGTDDPREAVSVAFR
ncbi:hypothetical protein [Haladaptatus sp. NG-SE-30]